MYIAYEYYSSADAVAFCFNVTRESVIPVFNSAQLIYLYIILV